MRVSNAISMVHRLQLARPVRLESSAIARSRQFSTTFLFGGRRPFLSLLASGLALGVGITTPIALFYHYSGIRNAVDTAQVTLSEINQARNGSTKSKPTQSLVFLRVAAKTYVQGIPFASYAVDKAFDSVEATIDAHQEEAAVIIENLGRKMAEIIEQHRTMTVPAAWELLKVVKEETGKLHQVAVKAATSAPVSESVHNIVSSQGFQAAKGAAESLGKGAVGFVKGKLGQRKQGGEESSEKTE
ncbi:hypothetical protein DFP72DRAFT_94235 [Ephemerocybe angulata]|uniref:Uncharacterized protein n=1 Tax=Ephemerocybe angulata TaxID=980116 RepID=A0A8H6I6Y8_9AGAR|nr:hypothetical protein DFP72DRAFT_94235 [Tulosesus angulatus]